MLHGGTSRLPDQLKYCCRRLGHKLSAAPVLPLGPAGTIARAATRHRRPGPALALTRRMRRRVMGHAPAGVGLADPCS